MADNDDSARNAATTTATTATAPPNSTTVPASVEDRPQLIARARAFLTSPAVQYQDIHAKRRFLLDKGLSEPEIEAMLREMVGVLIQARIFIV